jgi:transcriptional regulator with PAS, ATPase and Fis domain
MESLKKQNEFQDVVFASKLMEKLLKTVGEVAAIDSTIMLYGESGVGKDVIARYIHNNSPRSEKPFVGVNCAAIPSELIEAELFGYEKNSFTGADKNGRNGLFQAADGGTLFLDELGDLPLLMQSKLLKVLDTGEIRKVGGTSANSVDIRLIGATNKNLMDMIISNEFRYDLFYRINVLPITIPPLRERKEDIIVLSQYFLQYFNEKYRRQKLLNDKKIQILTEHNWPGNVRQLKNVIERYVIMGSDNEQFNSNFEDLLIEDEVMNIFTGENIQNKNYEENIMLLKYAMTNFEREYISKALNYCGGDVAKTAKLLGIHKSGIYRKVKEMSITNESRRTIHQGSML